MYHHLPQEFFNLNSKESVNNSYRFFNSDIQTSRRSDILEILRNSRTETALSRAIGYLSSSWDEPELPHSLIESIAFFIRNIENQRLINTFRFNHVDDEENELEIEFKADGFDDCELSIYYEESFGSVGKGFLMYKKGNEDYIVNGSIENLIQKFNETFT